MSETSAKTASKTKKKARKGTKRGASKKKTSRRGRGAKASATKVTKTTKKKTTKQKATKKKTRGPSRGNKRAPQGKRLGGWEKVKQADVFRHLEKTGTTIASLARTLGVGASAVHAWKAGRRFPSEQAQLKLRQILKGELPTLPPAKTTSSTRKTKAFNGKALRKVREERGLSRDRLSKQLKVSAGSIRNWEAGVSRPRGGNLAKVEEFLSAGQASSAASVSVSAPSVARTSGSAATGDVAVQGAAQIAVAYLAAGNTMSPNDVVAFVGALRETLG